MYLARGGGLFKDGNGFAHLCPFIQRPDAVTELRGACGREPGWQVSGLTSTISIGDSVSSNADGVRSWSLLGGNEASLGG